MESLGNLVNALIAVQKIFILTPFARSTSRETTDKFFGPYLMAQVEESCEREIGETPIIKVYSFNASSSERYAIHLDFSECADSILNFDVLIRVFATDSEGQGSTNTDADMLTLSIMPEIRIKHTSLNEYIGDSFKIDIDLFSGEIPTAKKEDKTLSESTKLFEFIDCETQLVTSNEDEECVNDTKDG